MLPLTENSKTVRVSNAVAAGTTDIEATAVDTLGFEAVQFEVLFGAIEASAVTSCKLQQSDDNGVADDWSDIEGTSLTVADDDDNKIALLELVRPQKRYVRPVVDRGTQNATVDGIVARLIGARTAPVTADSTVLGQEISVDKGEGTA